MMSRKIVARSLVIAVIGIASTAPAARGGVPEPDFVLHGTLAIDGTSVAADRDVTLEARVSRLSEPVGKYTMGQLADVGDSYLLRIRLEHPVSGEADSPNAAHIGDTVEIYALDSDNKQCAGGTFDGDPCDTTVDCFDAFCEPREILMARLVVNEAGLVQELDLGACGLNFVSSRLYVVPGGAGAQDGSSWQDAVGSFDTALAAKACVGDFISEIWLAAGTYKPTQLAQAGVPRSATFQVTDKVALYGGFNGTESALGERDIAANPTILSGDIGAAGVATDNAYHVVSMTNAGPGTVMDGLIIANGQATGTVNNGRGGGLWMIDSSPHVSNCSFDNNTGTTAGGGVYISGGNPKFAACSFNANIVTFGDGAAIHNLSSTTEFVDCAFTGNAATGAGIRRGGAIFNSGTGGPTCLAGSTQGDVCLADDDCSGGACGGVLISGCAFRSNTANTGGAIANLSSSPEIVDCVFEGNLANDGGAVHNKGVGGAMPLPANPRFTNCRFTGNRGTSWGGAISNEAETTTAVTNCSLVGNASPSGTGGAIGSRSNANNTVFVTNSILFGNTASAGTNDQDKQINRLGVVINMNYSCVQGLSGTLGGAGNIGSDPQFVRMPSDGGDGWGVGGNDDFGDLHLKTASACHDAGDNNVDIDPVFNPGAQPLPQFDLDGETRIAENLCVADTGNGGPPVVDMGVYEQATPAPLQTMYVNAATSGGLRDGSSWSDALTDLDLAMCVAENSGGAVDEIWVAAGTYVPTFRGTAGDPRSASFKLIDGVTVYGGFAGDEASPAERDPAANVTVLSGDLNGDDGANFANNGENVYHVLIGSGTDQTAVLDGVTVQGGNADATMGAGAIGGGMLISDGKPTIRNSVFQGNTARRGGAMYISENSIPQITACLFAENRALIDGGAVFNRYVGNPRFINCMFRGNETAGSGGGVMNADGSDPTFINCLLVDHAQSAIHNASFSECTLLSSTVANNGGWGVSNAGVDARVVNSIVWGNGGGQVQSPATVEYTDIQGGWGGPGTNNIAADPMFVSAGTGDFRITEGSPCVDAGDNSQVSPLATTDLAGNPRISHGVVDLGAYEVQLAFDGDFDGDGDVDLDDYLYFADCMNGPEVAPTPTAPTTEQDCLQSFDANSDGDVDLEDFAGFARGFTVP